MKIRTNYVSNSSSSSFIIECKNQEIANKLIEAYGQLYDYRMNICPQFQDEYIERDNYHIVSIKEIIKHFQDSYMNEEYVQKWQKELEEKEDKIFLLGYCYDDGNIESTIMKIFNEDVLLHMNNTNEYELIFSTRWS